ncbi:hypothetical protein RDWZM_009913 [Blomia tropicalis]|uniref:Amino acid transporter transmembrane domain-containing protein n=1 Tax=Blomia tropicalis TaxID=40697 RepID=A0A9Q0LYF6_BLOTA|nr:hypothetical protein BLOT_009908 [Blomia tropicalis]KAJ6215413.1 hypothetical protein RDWZM_009913 [Blomia tropicalis]
MAETYPLVVGLTFLFNLLLGTGVLTMPAVFAEAGYIVSILVISALCFISYIQVTFLVESMANANFIDSFKRKFDGEGETAALLFYESETDDDDDFVDYVTDDNNIYENADFSSNSDSKPIGQTKTKGLGESTCNIITNSDLSLNKPVIGINPTINVDDPDSLDTDNDKSVNGVDVQYCSGTSINNIGRSISDIGEPNQLKKIQIKRANFNIIEKFELGDMSQMFLKQWMAKCFFAAIIVYLFGDLLIYNTMMAKSLREISCTSKVDCDKGAHLDAPCWDAVGITRRNVYRIYLLLFVSILLPLTYFGLKKTSSIQIVTIILRWLAFFAMVGIAIKIFIQGEATGHPKAVNLASIPKLFGICIYSFMCHHSVPSIITPIKQKRNLITGLIIDYGLVLCLYLLISMTSIFAFKDIADVYTLNFQINDCPSNKTMDNVSNPGNVPVLSIFLPTYPIFTLFSSYSMIALTLINNMKVLGRNWFDIERPVLHYSFPMFALIPPLIISLFTEDVSTIVSYVGSYAGGFIQYVFPCLLVYYSRRMVKKSDYFPKLIREEYGNEFGRIMRVENDEDKQIDMAYKMINPFSSWFHSDIWVYLTMLWWAISVILVTVDRISHFIN